MKYNDSQLLAVSHGSGPMLVLAGPGSGKTTVIINRIHRMVSILKIPPESILAVTFSRAAAIEMENRYAALNTEDEKIPTFATFHSVFLNILKTDNPNRQFNMITDKQKYLFLRSEIERRNLPYENLNEYMNAIIASISRFKESEMDRSRSPLCLFISDDQFLQYYESYELFLENNGYIDFDDIIANCLKHLTDHPSSLRKWQNCYQYILVDEFQDISPLQYKVIRLLEGENHNIFVVGDDDQSIYGFRGASPKSMKTFMKDHPDARRVLLNINYRSSSSIISAALAVISQNDDRFDKNIIPSDSSTNGQITFKAFDKRYEEYINIINNIQKYNSKGIFDIAILFRNNSDSSLMIRLLSDYNIPYISLSSQNECMNHFTVKDMLSYMKLAENLSNHLLKDSLDELNSILNKPSRFIARDSLVGLKRYNAGECFERLYNVYNRNSFVSANIKRFEMSLRAIVGLSPYAAVKYIRNVIGYDNWLKGFAKEKNRDYEEYASHLDYFEEYLPAFKSTSELLHRLENEKEHNYSSVNQSPPENAITIMTMHSSKGMEFDTVFLPDSNDSIIPNKRALKEGSENEERRLYYVAMTRAKRNLHISYVKQLHNKAAYPTRFLKNLINPKS